ncbi:MAG TPA: hypothetical protein VHL34_17870 [Rhizomicrobium sp.]|nr:hypothetical protein [Rhizomicrobium sp.]
MKSMKVLAVAAVMTAGMAAPALADYVRLGSVEVGYRADRDSNFVRFGGGLEGLRFTADRSNIYCRNIRVTYRDGGRDNVFNGVLREDRPVNVDLRGGTRRVTRIDFNCRSDEFRGGKIYVNGDVGRYRDEWRRDPYWAGVWGSIFGSAMDSAFNDWISLGRERFSGRHDRESTFAGWRGRSVDRIGLKALDDDARCSRVSVRFGNGRTADLRVGFLQRGRVTVLDIPGRDRDVRSLNLACRAVGDRDVTIEILARR